MMKVMLSFLQALAEFSLLGCVECASVVLIFYYIYAKTRAPSIIASLFPRLNLNINYRSSLSKFNNMGNELLVTLRATKSESKLEYTLAHGIGTQNMLAVTPHAGRKPYCSKFDWGVYFPFVAQNWRIKKFQYPQVSNFVRNDAVLQRAIKQATDQIWRDQKITKHTWEDSQPTSVEELSAMDNGKEVDEDSHAYRSILKQQERRALTILRDMRSTLNNFLLTLTSWVLYKLLPCFLSGVVTHKQQIEMLKASSERAPGIPLIFLPLHRSHLDYIMVTFILANYDIRSPLVAAGNNLQIPVFGKLLRGLGAFFIKRKIDPIVGKKDILYRAVLHLYLQHALKMGHNVEFFIEGGRTRTGKPCMPKGGILSVIVNAFMDGSISDALLVPVSVNYERLVDGNFVFEQKGEKKSPETFGKAISAIWKALNSKYGLMRIDFNEPYSLKELVQSYNKIAKEEGNHSKILKPTERTLKHNQSTSSLYGTDVVCEEHRNLIDSISRQVVYDCAAATSVMSTNALSFLMLTYFREGALLEDIAKELDKLRRTLQHRKDLGFSGESMHIIKYAHDLLGEDLITRADDINGQTTLRPVQKIESMIELAYYSNMLTPHFALESIVLITFHALLRPGADGRGDNCEVGTTRNKLIEKALVNCQVFRYEYILSKPTQVLETLLQASLDELITRGLIQLSLVAEQHFENTRVAQRMADYLEDWEDETLDEIPEKEMLDLVYTPNTVLEQKALCEVLAPFSCTYLAVAKSLTLLYRSSMLESEFVKYVIKDLTNKIKSGVCSYAESISTDSVRNCLKLLEKWTVIEISNQHGLRVLSLTTLYDMSRDSLRSITDRIEAVVPNYKSGYF